MGEFRKWASTHNLSRIVRFHNDLRSCMGDASAKADEFDSTETTFWKARWQDYDSLLHANTFLMLYAHTEEWLHLLSKKYHPEFSIKKGGSITRYKLVLRDGFGMDVSDGVWHLLTDCEKIRNCLLHANGRVDLMENETEIREVAKRRGVDVKLERLQIPSDFLASFTKEVEAFIKGLLHHR